MEVQLKWTSVSYAQLESEREKKSSAAKLPLLKSLQPDIIKHNIEKIHFFQTAI